VPNATNIRVKSSIVLLLKALLSLLWVNLNTDDPALRVISALQMIS